jgi:hypothetical protein
MNKSNELAHTSTIRSCSGSILPWRSSRRQRAKRSASADGHHYSLRDTRILCAPDTDCSSDDATLLLVASVCNL